MRLHLLSDAYHLIQGIVGTERAVERRLKFQKMRTQEELTAKLRPKRWLLKRQSTINKGLKEH